MLQCSCYCVCCDVQTFLVDGKGDVQRDITCPGCSRRLRLSPPTPFGEAEWLACQDPNVLVQWRDARVTERKHRLFLCAYCRLLLFPKGIDREAIEVAERYADGLASEEELAHAHRRAAGPPNDSRPSIAVACNATWPKPFLNFVRAYRPRLNQRPTTQAATVADLFRDIIGNPFHPLPVLPAAVLSWNDRTVARLASTIYEDRSFERLPLLADALLDAGCDDEELLAHCRSPGPHARGCWAVDLVLSKDR